MPPPGSADSGSDDPPSESSDAATSEPRTCLVMSGGEGYIDFRMGEPTKHRCGSKGIALGGANRERFIFLDSFVQHILT